MELFFVLKQGRVSEEFGGAYSTAELAEHAAMTLIALERDDYHSYVVVKKTLDVIPENNGDNIVCHDKDVVAAFYRDGEEIIRGSGGEVRKTNA